MSAGILGFIIGFMIGGMFGVMMLALLMASRDDDERRLHEENSRKTDSGLHERTWINHKP
jgi:hypothetical protein